MIRNLLAQFFFDFIKIFKLQIFLQINIISSCQLKIVSKVYDYEMYFNLMNKDQQTIRAVQLSIGSDLKVETANSSLNNAQTFSLVA